MTQDRDRTRPQADGDGEDPFLARWSRRKRAVQDRGTAPAADEDAPEPPVAEHAPSEPAPEPGVADAGGPAAEGVEDADLPPPESLGPDSDFSAYLSRRVSGGLRRAAMRRLFALPGFNVRDGLDDYDEDYTQFAGLGDTVTADMKHHAERLRARRAAEEEGGDGPEGEGADSAGEEPRRTAAAAGDDAAQESGAQPDAAEPGSDGDDDGGDDEHA